MVNPKYDTYILTWEAHAQTLNEATDVTTLRD